MAECSAGFDLGKLVAPNSNKTGRSNELQSKKNFLVKILIASILAKAKQPLLKAAIDSAAALRASKFC